MKTYDELFNEPARARALAEFLGADMDDLTEQTWDSCQFDADAFGEYQVLTDSEADDLWEEALDSYLDQCIYPELPEPLSRYFDDEAWKRDARTDGRAHAINSYDGGEDYASDPITGEEFVIYRTN